MTHQSAPADDYFVVPGTLRVSESALALARRFAKQIRGSMTGEYTVVAFTWAFRRTLQKAPGAPIVELGAAFDLGLYRRSIVPREAMHNVAGLEFAINVPPWIYEASRERMIDIEDTGDPHGIGVSHKLVLR